MRYVIYGAGAIGATIGGLLHRSGAPVCCIARGEHAQVMAASGLELLDTAGLHRIDVPVVQHPSEADLGPDDVVLLCMKSQDSAAALDALVACGFDGAVVCAQNGVDNERQALRRFAAVYGLCVQLPGTFLEPGRVACHGSPVPGVLDVGRYPAGTDERSDALAAALQRAGFVSRSEPDIMAMKYAKLLGNLANALDAAVDRSAMRSEIAKAARREGKACFDAAGLRCLDQASFTARVEALRIVELDGVAQRGSSSWQSLVKGAATVETDYLNGEIVLLGRLHGVPTPVNTVLQRLMADMVRAGAAPNSFGLAALEALVADERLRTGPPG